MSIFNPTLTPTQQATVRFTQMLNGSAGVLQQQADLIQQSWKFVWQNPQGLTPQAVLDLIQVTAVARGSTCAQVFANHVAAVAYLNSAIPGIVPTQYTTIPPGKTLAANPDGSLTVSG
jgi:hypothetical protein